MKGRRECMSVAEKVLVGVILSIVGLLLGIRVACIYLLVLERLKDLSSWLFLRKWKKNHLGETL